MYYYIHIPFCERKCLHCSFISFEKQTEIYRAYREFLKREIQTFLYSYKHAYPVESIYFGWGTPSILSWEDLFEIIQIFKSFSWGNIGEVTIETPPWHISRSRLEEWRDIGISRVSIGIQTWNEQSLQAIGRKSVESKETLFHDILHSPYFVFAFDFIFWLPFSQEHTTLEDIDACFRFLWESVHHISVYFFEKETFLHNVAFHARKQYTSLPEWYVSSYKNVRNYLHHAWFSSYEISNFSKAWFECKHNQAYWNHAPVKGFWLGAHSYLDGVRSYNGKTWEEYFSWKCTFERLTEEDIRIEQILFWLRTKGVPLHLLSKQAKEHVYFLEENGFVSILWNTILPTVQGILVLDTLLLFLIE